MAGFSLQHVAISALIVAAGVAQVGVMTCSAFTNSRLATPGAPITVTPMRVPRILHS